MTASFPVLHGVQTSRAGFYRGGTKNKRASRRLRFGARLDLPGEKPQAAGSAGDLLLLGRRADEETEEPAQTAARGGPPAAQPIDFAADRVGPAVGEVRAKYHQHEKRQVPENVNAALIGVPELDANDDRSGQGDDVGQVLRD